MMRGDDDMNFGSGQGGGYAPTDSGGARQRRAPSGGNDQQYTYSSIPTTAQHDSGHGYGPDADGLKKKSTSFSTPSFNSFGHRNRSAVVGGPGGPSFFASAAHMSEGPNQPFYRDYFNDQPSSCDFGTGEENGIWMNGSDQAGTVS